MLVLTCVTPMELGIPKISAPQFRTKWVLTIFGEFPWALMYTITSPIIWVSQKTNYWAQGPMLVNAKKNKNKNYIYIYID